MAQPQGLNVPAILTTGIVGTILTMAIVEGVRAYNNYYTKIVDAQSWDLQRIRAVDVLKTEQKRNLSVEMTSIPIDAAMQKFVESGGKRPTTQPEK